MKYLVTDDSKMARRMVIKLLKELINDKDEIFEATNGQEAIDVYKEHRPDLCFMDLTMPIVDGLEATKQIVEFDKNAKVVVVTADIQEGAKDRALKNGARAFVKKPINETKIKQMIRSAGW